MNNINPAFKENYTTMFRFYTTPAKYVNTSDDTLWTSRGPIRYDRGPKQQFRPQCANNKSRYVHSAAVRGKKGSFLLHGEFYEREKQKCPTKQLAAWISAFENKFRGRNFAINIRCTIHTYVRTCVCKCKFVNNSYE